MSRNEPADLAAFRELDLLVRHLGDELSAFRRRALQAEARVRALEAASGTKDLFSSERVAELERENLELRARVASATTRTQALLGRVRFLRQQQEQRGEAR